MPTNERIELGFGPVLPRQRDEHGQCQKCRSVTVHFYGCELAPPRREGASDGWASTPISSAAGRLENARRAIDAGVITVAQAAELLEQGDNQEARVPCGDLSFKDLCPQTIRRRDGDQRCALQVGHVLPCEFRRIEAEKTDARLAVGIGTDDESRKRCRDAADGANKAKRFAAALDRALPEPSMAQRPGEQCRVCGGAVPRKPWAAVAEEPDFDGWGRFAFPWPGGHEGGSKSLEWLNLCPRDAKRVAEYIAYCCANPHARNGE